MTVTITTRPSHPNQFISFTPFAHGFSDQMTQGFLHHSHVGHDFQVFFQERYGDIDIFVNMRWQNTLYRFYNIVDIRLPQSEPLINAEGAKNLNLWLFLKTPLLMIDIFLNIVSYLFFGTIRFQL
jgi:hypothetical protein